MFSTLGLILSAFYQSQFKDQMQGLKTADICQSKSPLQYREHCLKCTSVSSAVLSSIMKPGASNVQPSTHMDLGVVWVLGCCTYLVHLLLSLTACLAPPVFTSWMPSLTTCCPQRGGHCQDDRDSKVGMCCWWSRWQHMSVFFISSPLPS